MGFLDSGGSHHIVFFSLIITSSVISSLFSFLNIYLIYVMKSWNGHILLILSMAWSQLIYDLSFAPGVVTIYNNGVVITANVFQLIGGLGVAIFSNIMSFIVLYVIKYKVSIDILRYYKYYCLVIGTIIIAEIILYLMAALQPSYNYLSNIALLGIYYYFRLVSIGLNFVACGLSYAYVWRMERMIHGQKTRQEEAICALSSRMQFYPLIQALSRAGLSWYEFSYGWNFDPESVTLTQFICQVICALTTPTASIGYFIIFVLMQPKAYKTLKSWFQWTRCSKTDKDNSNNNNNDDVHMIHSQTKDLSITDNNIDESKREQPPYPSHQPKDSFYIPNSRVSSNSIRYTMQDYNEEELCDIIDYGHTQSEYGSSVFGLNENSPQSQSFSYSFSSTSKTPTGMGAGTGTGAGTRASVSAIPSTANPMIISDTLYNNNSSY